MLYNGWAKRGRWGRPLLANGRPLLDLRGWLNLKPCTKISPRWVTVVIPLVVRRLRIKRPVVFLPSNWMFEPPLIWRGIMWVDAGYDRRMALHGFVCRSVIPIIPHDWPPEVEVDIVWQTR